MWSGGRATYGVPWPDREQTRRLRRPGVGSAWAGDVLAPNLERGPVGLGTTAFAVNAAWSQRLPWRRSDRANRARSTRGARSQSPRSRREMGRLLRTAARTPRAPSACALTSPASTGRLPPSRASTAGVGTRRVGTRELGRSARRWDRYRLDLQTVDAGKVRRVAGVDRQVVSDCRRGNHGIVRPSRRLAAGAA
jgi:hypothetical protein